MHVDKVSSAHVYLRLNPGQTLDDVDMAVIEDAAQLVKANSIQGNKMNDIDVVYTLWENLHKTESMEVGQVGFHKQKEVRKIRVAKRENLVVNRLNKTKEERTSVDFREEREKRDRSEREEKKRAFKASEDARKAEEKARKEESERRSYSTYMTDEKMTSNQGGGNDSDDFM